MRHILALAAMAASLSAAGAVLAQQPAAKPTAPTTGAPATAQPSDASRSAAPESSTPTPPSSSATPASGAAANTAANAGGGLMTGMSVKALKDGVATIQMGSDTFTVDSSKLGVSSGAATINATQAQLKQMIAGATKK